MQALGNSIISTVKVFNYDFLHVIKEILVPEKMEEGSYILQPRAPSVSKAAYLERKRTIYELHEYKSCWKKGTAAYVSNMK